MTVPEAAQKAMTLSDRVTFGILRALFAAARRLPYRRRVPFVGWVTRRLVAPAAGYNRRSRENLAMIFPEMPAAVRRQVAAAAADNAGRTLAEIFSGAEFVEQVRHAQVTGPGMAAVEAAQAAGRPVVLVSGHFGNYDVMRGLFAARGVAVAGLYKPLGNPAFNEIYVAAIGSVNGPAFPRGRQGLGRMVQFLRAGGILGVLTDQRIAGGAPLDFLGHPALTALSAAELALKYDALLVPVYGIRQPDGLGFELATEAPIPHSDATTMMQAVNDSLSARVRAHPGQYFWIHRRWR